VAAAAEAADGEAASGAATWASCRAAACCAPCCMIAAFFFVGRLGRLPAAGLFLGGSLPVATAGEAAP